MKLNIITLIAITALAAVLRLYNLDSVPPGVNRDEASIGITAKSLATTARDEYGRLLPLSFESFGDWKLPFYIYTTIPFIKIFGSSEIAVRLPSALAGIATVLWLYFLAKHLFGKELIAHLAAFALAIMPWHIHISRVESEAIVATFFITLSLYLTLRGIATKSKTHILLSALFLGLTYYTYHGNHISTSLIVLGLAGIYRKEIVKIPHWKNAAAVLVFLVVVILSITFGADHTKISGISIFGNPTTVHEQIELPRLTHEDPNSLWVRIQHNRVTYAVRTVFQNYLLSYGPEFLFIRGGKNNAHNIQGYGNLHPIDAIFLFLGVVALIITFHKKESRLILWWIAIGAIAASITKDAPHSNRMLAVVPALALAIASGMYYILNNISKKWLTIPIVIITIVYAISMMHYGEQYFYHFPRSEAKNWGYGYKELTVLLEDARYKDKNVIMTRPETSPYVYILFYSDYPMDKYQLEATRYPITQDGFRDVSGFGRFSFRKINWDTDPHLRNTLIVVSPDEVHSSYEANTIATITYPDGNAAFVVLDTKK